MDFDPTLLLAAYDRGRLVPFIGAGMSRPACVGWKPFVRNLEAQCKLPKTDGEPIQRAFHAVQRLRLLGTEVPKAVADAVYTDDKSASRKVPAHTEALASLFWPLVCTTNYDDIYVRGRTRQRSRKPEQPRPLSVVGRSDADCHRVLRHMSFPAGELVWALQGFLRPRDRGLVHPDRRCEAYPLEKELVVGHAEYRRVANREPHFRRCFSEVFRRSCLLFLGSGLTEPYFLGLLDEILELTGPPELPHFAFVESGKIDQDLMQQRYHIHCMTYPAKEHGQVECYLREFRDAVTGCRVRCSGWGYRAVSPSRARRCTTGDSFRIVRGVLPDPGGLRNGHGAAISCGREGSIRGRR